MIDIITGAIGGGYFLYGKRQKHPVTMICGTLLCLAPYFTDSLILLCVISAVLIAAPFLLR
jgi:hypothetical protein